MLQFFIDLYENIIQTYDHLDQHKLPLHNASVNNSNHHIITIYDNDTLPQISYESMLNSKYCSLKYPVAKVSTIPYREHSPLVSTNNQDITLQVASSAIFHDIRLSESKSIDHNIVEDYCIVQKQNDENDEWEIV
jgi:hypothetical protein